MIDWPIALLLAIAAEEPRPLPTISVVARRPDSLLELPLTAHTTEPQPGDDHVAERLSSLPATWISRGSGQEHLTAIRSPVLTGAGACGAFLYLENGIPIRPPGFCNVNNLFELVWESAESLEVVAGPGGALYGANALHGMINAQMPGPHHERQIEAVVGDDAARSLRLELGNERLWGGLVLTDAGSFRADESSAEAKLHLRGELPVGTADVSSWLSATDLDQETAGFIFGFNAYRDPVQRRGNVNPEAFRQARSVRAASRWSWSSSSWQHQLTPFARSSDMTFLQHFLPGQPLERNGQESVGVQYLARRPGPLTWTLGADLDVARGDLLQEQAGPTEGSAFLRETRPVGRHYDYEVDAMTTALYGQVEAEPGQHWLLTAGLRLEQTRYDHDNRMATGNLREDGTACGFGGCIYQRPADREDSYLDAAPHLSVVRDLGRGGRAYLRLARGFRPPQATELYRLQRGQEVADLESEKLDSAELGYKWSGAEWQLSTAIWAMNKRNFIFRDAEGFNVADGKTRHRGIDLAADWRRGVWSMTLAASVADHEYAASRNPAFGEEFVAGNEVDTAPTTLAYLTLARDETAGGTLAASWQHMGSYYLDAANEHDYPGHDLLHLRWTRDVGDLRWSVGLENALNRRYAERADFAFGDYRYFPGQGRTWMVGLRWAR